MARFAFPQPAHPQGLRDELLAGGIPIALVQADPADPARTLVDVPDEAYDAAGQPVPADPQAWYDQVAAVVAAHNVAAYTAREDAARTAYDAAVAYLKTFEAQPSGSATNVQRDNALKACITVLKTQHQQLRAQGG